MAAGTYHSREEFLSKVIRPSNAGTTTPAVAFLESIEFDDLWARVEPA